LEKRETIRTYIGSLLKEHDDTKPFSDDENLIVSGRLDSLNVLAIVTFLDSNYRFSLDASQFDPLKFGSVDSIMGLLTGWRSAAAKCVR
jgi:aryl carrier-like protein